MVKNQHLKVTVKYFQVQVDLKIHLQINIFRLWLLEPLYAHLHSLHALGKDSSMRRHILELAGMDSHLRQMESYLCLGGRAAHMPLLPMNTSVRFLIQQLYELFHKLFASLACSLELILVLVLVGMDNHLHLLALVGYQGGPIVHNHHLPMKTVFRQN